MKTKRNRFPLVIKRGSSAVKIYKDVKPRGTYYRVAKAIPFLWKQNVLRHSFISYRLAEIQNVNQAALEAGNLPQMIFRHYRELATPEQART